MYVYIYIYVYTSPKLYNPRNIVSWLPWERAFFTGDLHLLPSGSCQILIVGSTGPVCWTHSDPLIGRQKAHPFATFCNKKQPFFLQTKKWTHYRLCTVTLLPRPYWTLQVVVWASTNTSVFTCISPSKSAMVMRVRNLTLSTPSHPQWNPWHWFHFAPCFFTLAFFGFLLDRKDFAAAWKG